LEAPDVQRYPGHQETITGGEIHDEVFMISSPHDSSSADEGSLK
jgi:hypothetical protein